jgi:hypothetical protein
MISLRLKFTHDFQLKVYKKSSKNENAATCRHVDFPWFVYTLVLLICEFSLQMLVANQDRVFFYVYCQGIKSLKRFCPKHICAEINAVMPHIMKGYFIAVKHNSFGQVSLSIIS